MSIDHRLLTLLVCPLCKGPLDALRNAELQVQELACRGDHLAFPIRDGLPIMLEPEARALSEADLAALPPRTPA